MSGKQPGTLAEVMVHTSPGAWASRPRGAPRTSPPGVAPRLAYPNGEKVPSGVAKVGDERLYLARMIAALSIDKIGDQMILSIRKAPMLDLSE